MPQKKRKGGNVNAGNGFINWTGSIQKRLEPITGMIKNIVSENRGNYFVLLRNASINNSCFAFEYKAGLITIIKNVSRLINICLIGPGRN
ncbi:MAG: hypothetical protein ABIU77_16780 [Ferruginibacter sp.]